MSLILEALKKLEREKQAPERGFLVLAPTSWPSRSRRVMVPLAVGALVVVTASVTVAIVRWRSKETVSSRPAGEPVAALAGSTVAPAPGAAAAASAPGATLPVPAAKPVEPASPPRTEAVPATPAVTRQEEALVAFRRGAPARTSRGPAANPPAQAAAPPGQAQPPSAGASVAGSAAPGTAAPPEVFEITHGASVPAHPAAPPRISIEGVRLEAISMQDGHPVAVLNGRLVREGESLDDVRVVRIGADEVELESHGRRRVLKF